MDNLSAEIMSRLDNKISFVIPIFGGVPVPESVVISWGIMAALVLFSILFVRNLKTVPKGMQLYIEMAVGSLNRFFYDILGEEGKVFFPWLSTVALYILLSNLMGLFGFAPPTKDLNVTAGLAIMSIILIEYAGIRSKGFKGFMKSFAQPMAVVAPLNVLEVLIRPLSLCMRLFGNILGGFVVMELIKIMVPPVVPVIFGLYFDIFDGGIQTYVFVFLTALFMKEAMEE